MTCCVTTTLKIVVDESCATVLSVMWKLTTERIMDVTKLSIDVPNDLLRLVFSKNPKDPWGRFVGELNFALGTNYDEGFVRLVRAFAEFDAKSTGKECKRIEKNLLRKIGPMKQKGYSNKEISKMLSLSESTVSRVLRTGKNLEPSQN